MRNLYPGICFRCKSPVAPGAGHFERIRRPHQKRKWLLQHAGCAIKYRDTEIGRIPAAGEKT